MSAPPGSRAVFPQQETGVSWRSVPRTRSGVCPGQRERGRAFTSDSGLFLHGVGGANHLGNSTLTFTERTNRHFSIMWGGGAEGQLHLITVGYSLHPLEKFTSSKEISRSAGMGWAGGGRLLIFTVCLAQFNSTCPPHFSNRFKFFSASVCSVKERDTAASSLPPPWFLVSLPWAGWECLPSRERQGDNTA